MLRQTNRSPGWSLLQHMINSKPDKAVELALQLVKPGGRLGPVGDIGEVPLWFRVEVCAETTTTGGGYVHVEKSPPTCYFLPSGRAL